MAMVFWLDVNNPRTGCCFLISYRMMGSTVKKVYLLLINGRLSLEPYCDAVSSDLDYTEKLDYTMTKVKLKLLWGRGNIKPYQLLHITLKSSLVSFSSVSCIVTRRN